MYNTIFSRLLVLLTLFSISIISCSNKTKQVPQVKNVILLIGDGMGTTQVYAAMSVADNKLNLERSHYFGYSKTYSASNYTTDSGAGGTAISTGKKTKNYSIGVDTNGKPLKSILEYANEKNLATGLVTTCNLAHATPASFVAHEVKRTMYPEIAKDFLKTKVDVLIGGGKVLFDTNKVASQMIKNGYEVAYSLNSIQSTSDTPLACFVADDHPARILDGRGNMLPEATQVALSRLSSNLNGFFLMVEGSQIDWGGHSNDIDYITSELIDFDIAVGLAYDFADSHPGTLVIVTADHETGGLTIPAGSIEEKSIQSSFSTGSHTGVMVPIFAYGTGAEQFSAIMENTDIFNKMMAALQLSE
jgi:alkaline phosphatase